MFKIKQELIELFKVLSVVFNDRRLINNSSAPLFMPFYHYVSDQSTDYLANLYQIRKIDDFKEDLEYFLRYFSPVEVAYLSSMPSNNLPLVNGKPPMHLSFDDGLENCSSVIAPILKEKGIPATFFVTKNFTEGIGSFYRFDVSRIISRVTELTDNQDYKIKIKNVLQQYSLWEKGWKHSLLKLNQNHRLVIDELLEVLHITAMDKSPFMDTKQVMGLRNSGFTIGAHTVSHPLFSSCELSEMKLEIENSVNWVVDSFNMDQRLFAFPFSDDGVPLELFNWMYGDKAVVDLAFGTSGLKNGLHPRHLQRVPMEMYQSKPANRIKAEYLYQMLRGKFVNN